MTSLKVKFRASKVEGKEGSLMIQIIHDRRVRVLSTGLKIYENEWDYSKGEIVIDTDVASGRIGFDKVKSLYDRSLYLNSVKLSLEEKIIRIKTIIMRLQDKGPYTVSQVAEAYQSDSLGGFFFPFMREQIRKLNDNGQHKTASTYETTMRIFSSYVNGADLRFEQIDVILIKSFETYLKSKGLVMNSVSFYLRILKAVYNKAVKEGIISQAYPFRGVYTGVAMTIKRAVDETVITELKEMELSKSLAFSRDLFLFSFYTRGMSFVDVAYLEKTDIIDGVIVYNRRKTGQRLAIKIEPVIQEIIDKYAHRTANLKFLFPIFTSNNPNLKQYSSAIRLHNYHLRIISEKLHLKVPLTSYVARHTWATIAKKKGIDLRIISDGMGHTSEHTTQIYLASLDRIVLDEANSIVISLKNN